MRYARRRTIGTLDVITHISRRYPFCEATFVIDVQNTITAAVWSIRRRPSTVRGGRSGRGGGEEQRICGFLRSIVHTFEGYAVGSYLRGSASGREEKDADEDDAVTRGASRIKRPREGKVTLGGRSRVAVPHVDSLYNVTTSAIRWTIRDPRNPRKRTL